MAVSGTGETVKINFIPSLNDLANLKNSVRSLYTSIKLKPRNGQRTVWRFVNVVLNPQIDDKVFQFEIPEGIEVIENSYGQ